MFVVELCRRRVVSLPGNWNCPGVRGWGTGNRSCWEGAPRGSELLGRGAGNLELEMERSLGEREGSRHLGPRGEAASER